MIPHEPIRDAHELAAELDHAALHQITPPPERVRRWADAAYLFANESAPDDED